MSDSKIISQLKLRRVLLLAGIAALAVPAAGYAQSIPSFSSGRADQEIRTAPPAVIPTEKPSPLPAGAPGNSDLRARLRSGERVTVHAIRFSGNRHVSTIELTRILPTLLPNGESIGDLDGIADTVTRYYRSKGYPFARAMFQAQASADGVLELTIFEGQFGKVTIHNSSRLRGSIAKDMAEDNLCDGASVDCKYATITDEGLQRSTLLLSDVPGVAVTSAFKRGQDVGTADLDLDITEAPPFVVTAGVDNFGASSTGEVRGTVGLTGNDLLGFGDQINVNVTGSGEELWDVSGDYSMLVGASGLRAGISGGHTHYMLGDIYAPLGVNGLADTGSAFATYPVIRSIDLNITAGLAYTHKELHDNIGYFGIARRSALDDANFSVQGDALDDVLGGGADKFSITYTRGFLHLNDAFSISQDQDPTAGLQTKGAFDKVSFSLERQQVLWGGWSLYTAAHGQYADRNLSSAEQTYLGGPDGVRAYSIGEGGGDTAVVGSAEVRYAFPFQMFGDNLLTVGGFYDGGWVRRNAHPLVGEQNNMDVGGAGVRVTLARQGFFTLSGMYANQLGGRQSVVEPNKDDHYWLQAAFQF